MTQQLVTCFSAGVFGAIVFMVALAGLFNIY